ncbi:glycosyltransferase [Catellatospora sp. KI3]|uniref:glycosyltransferase n=1 Tax=Catellatospora sp. KI3 TaxID=3041620 RepID=UPI0024827C3E|nr:glycosyltransferase [Catellatospora sp. KI3]MDI1460064.1 glycosyltransferase [Catellatospora sp. KI3]
MSRRRAPRVLYLSFYFPPSRASGVFRALATANHLVRAGWDVTVCTAPREFFGEHLAGAVDESLDAEVDPRIRVERVPAGDYHWETDVRRFGPVRRRFPTVVDKLHRGAQKYVFAERYLGWAPGVLRRAVAMHLKDPFDLVLATGNPFVSFALAWALGRTLRVPYAVDFRDAWTFDQFTEKVRFPEGGSMMRWEARVLRDAAEVSFVNSGMLRWYAERYPYAADRMTVVPNGWEPEILGTPAFAPTPAGRPLSFGYLGTVTPYLPLDVLFDGWRRAREHALLADATLDIHGHLGFFPDQRDELLARLPLGDGLGVRYRGAFGKTDAPAVYAGTDVLVFCVPGARYVTTGKVFEYMAAAKPIVSVHQPEIAAADVLRDYPLWFPGDRLDADSVAESMVAAGKAALDLDEPQHTAALAHARRFTRDATLAPWEQRLRGIAGGAR